MEGKAYVEQKVVEDKYRLGGEGLVLKPKVSRKKRTEQSLKKIPLAASSLSRNIPAVDSKAGQVSRLRVHPHVRP